MAEYIFHDIYKTPMGAENCDYLNVSICDTTQNNDEFSIGLYSPGSHDQTVPIRLPVDGASFTVTDASGKEITSDVVPVSKATENIRRTRGTAKSELWFLAETKATDLVVYTVKKSTKKSNPEITDDNMISNEKYKITFGDAGLETINGVKISNSILYFNSSQGYGQNSGAYIFRPNKTEPDVINEKPTVSIIKGKGVQQATVTWGDWASQVYRLYQGKY